MSLLQLSHSLPPFNFHLPFILLFIVARRQAFNCFSRERRPVCTLSTSYLDHTYQKCCHWADKLSLVLLPLIDLPIKAPISIAAVDRSLLSHFRSSPASPHFQCLLKAGKWKPWTQVFHTKVFSLPGLFSPQKMKTKSNLRQKQELINGEYLYPMWKNIYI